MTRGFIATEAMDKTRETVLSLGARMGEEGRSVDLTPAEQAVAVLAMTIDQLITKFQAFVEREDEEGGASFERLDETFDDARMIVGRVWEDSIEDPTLKPCDHPGCPAYVAKSIQLCLWHKES